MRHCPESGADNPDDWYASGMAGTGSNTVVADEVFVPALVPTR